MRNRRRWRERKTKEEDTGQQAATYYTAKDTPADEKVAIEKTLVDGGCGDVKVICPWPCANHPDKEMRLIGNTMVISCKPARNF